MKKRKFISLQYKFFIYFLILSTIPTIVTGILTYRQSSKIIVEKAKEVNAQKLTSVASNIDSVMAHANEVSHLILQNAGVRNYLYGVNPDAPADIMSFLVPFTGYSSNIATIRIYDKSGRLTMATGDSYALEDLSSLQKAEADTLKGYYMWHPHNLTPASFYGNATDTFCYVRQYRDIYNPTIHLGYISIDIPTDVILNTWQSRPTSPTGIFFVLDEKEQIVLSNDTKYVGEQILNTQPGNDNLTQIGSMKLEDTFVINAHALSNTGWTIVDLTPINELLSDSQIVFNMVIAVISCNVLLCICVALLISKWHLKPLRILGELIRDAKHQDFKEYMGATSNDEIGLLATEFNKMSQHFEVLVNQVHVAQLKQSDAEFNALQAQINPHFLYNTLDTIYWMCRLEHADEASTLVQALGDMFRLSLNKGEGLIALEDELKHLNSYLLIQKMRCKTTVHVDVKIDENPALHKAKVIKLVLQPLVENAFVHGTTDGANPIQIWISVFLEDHTIVYIIKDDGAGIEKDLLSILNTPGHNYGFGLRNVNERIKLLFGDSYGITIESLPGQGTTVKVTQPFTPSFPPKE